MQNPLSKELKIACEIYKHNITGNIITTSGLVKRFKNEMTKQEVLDGINILLDWSMIGVHHTPIKNGKDVLTYHITSETLPLVKELYKKWWN